MFEIHRCLHCGHEFYTERDRKSRCPHCRERVRRADGGGWGTILVTVLLIVLFVMLFGGSEGGTWFGGWFQQLTTG